MKDKEHEFELVVTRRHPPLLLDQTELAFNLVAFPVDLFVVFPRLLTVKLQLHDTDAAQSATT